MSRHGSVHSNMSWYYCVFVCDGLYILLYLLVVCFCVHACVTVRRDVMVAVFPYADIAFLTWLGWVVDNLCTCGPVVLCSLGPDVLAT